MVSRMLTSHSRRVSGVRRHPPCSRVRHPSPLCPRGTPRPRPATDIVLVPTGAAGATSTTARTRAPPGAPPLRRLGVGAGPGRARLRRRRRGDRGLVRRQRHATSTSRPTSAARSTATDVASFAGVTLRINRDDGAVVYLNGGEVFRTNMPAGTITLHHAGHRTRRRENTFVDDRIDPARCSTAPTCSRSRSTRPAPPARTSASTSS